MSLTPGATLGPYEVVSELGSGGMGIVYRARDPRLERDVAIKLLPPHLTGDPAANQRFRQEAQAASALDHPNICTIHEIDQTPDGRLFLVMACYEGETLRERIARGPLGLDDAIDIVRQAGEGLAEAHRAGITHRDIKPANLLVTTTGAVKILDFGVAKLTGGEAVTQTGTTVGTMAYMSPEQARGLEVDHRTDIWSLGAVLHEMLTGQAPFRGDNVMAVCHAILEHDPPSLPASSSPAEGLVARALSKDRAERYQSMTELLDALKRLRSPDALTVAATTGPTLLAIAVLPFTNMSTDPEQEYFSDGLTDEIIADLSQIRDLRVTSRTSVMQLKGARKDLKTIGRDLNVRYLLEGSVRKAGNSLRITAQLIDATTDAHLWAEKYSGTLDDVFDIQERVSRAIVEGLKVRLSPDEDRALAERPIANLTAYEYFLRARNDIWRFRVDAIDRAMDLIDRGLEITGENEQFYALKSFAHQTYVNMLSRPPEQFAAILEEAERCAVKALAINPRSSMAHYARAWCYQQSGRPREAIRHFQRAVGLDRNLPDANLLLGYMLAATGSDPDSSRRLLAAARDLDPLNPNCQMAPGILHLFNGDLQAAVDSTRALLRSHTDLPDWIVWWTAWVHVLKGDLDDALRFTDSFARDNPGHVMADLLSFLACAWRGERQRALAAVTPRWELAAWWDDLYSLWTAEAYALIGSHDHAFTWLEHAVDYGIANVRFLGEHDPFLRSLRSDVRFAAVMARARQIAESIGPARQR